MMLWHRDHFSYVGFIEVHSTGPHPWVFVYLLPLLYFTCRTSMEGLASAKAGWAQKDNPTLKDGQSEKEGKHTDNFTKRSENAIIHRFL